MENKIIEEEPIESNQEVKKANLIKRIFKSKGRKIIIALIAAVIIASSVFYFILNGKIKNNTLKNVVSKDQIFYTNCYRPLNLVPGDEFKCEMGYYTKKWKNISVVAGEISFGKGYKIVEVDSTGKWDIKTNNYEFTSTYADPKGTKKGVDILVFTVKVTDKINWANSEISIRNITAISCKETISFPDLKEIVSPETIEDVEEAGAIYIYKVQNDDESPAYYVEPSRGRIIGDLIYKYKCKDESCQYDDSLAYSLNTILVTDNNKVFAYNYITEKTTKYDFKGKIAYASYMYAPNKSYGNEINWDEVYGIKVAFSNEDQNVYSFNKEKYIFEKDVWEVTTYLPLDKGYLLVYICSGMLQLNCNSSIVNAEDGKIIKSIPYDGIKDNKYFTYANADDYYWLMLSNMNFSDGEYEEQFLDKKFNYINEVITNESTLASGGYSISNIDGSLILPKEYNKDTKYYNSFVKYDINGNLVHTSKKYEMVQLDHWGENVLVDNDGYYKLIDANDKEIINVTESTNKTKFKYFMNMSDTNIEIAIFDSSINPEDYYEDNQDVELPDNSKFYYSYIYNKDTKTIEKDGPYVDENIDE